MQMNTKQRLASIEQELVAKSDTKAKEAFQEFIPPSQRAYGVLVPFLNQIAKKHREGGFELAEALWKSGAFEERVLAAKLLGSSGKNDPDRAIKLAKRFATQISDWVVCDTLGMQGLRAIAAKKRTDLFAWSNSLVESKNPWERRLGLVLLTNFIKDRNSRPLIKNTLARLSADREHYVKKAVEWIQRDLL